MYQPRISRYTAAVKQNIIGEIETKKLIKSPCNCHCHCGESSERRHLRRNMNSSEKLRVNVHSAWYTRATETKISMWLRKEFASLLTAVKIKLRERGRGRYLVTTVMRCRTKRLIIMTLAASRLWASVTSHWLNHAHSALWSRISNSGQLRTSSVCSTVESLYVPQHCCEWQLYNTTLQSSAKIYS